MSNFDWVLAETQALNAASSKNSTRKWLARRQDVLSNCVSHTFFKADIHPMRNFYKKLKIHFEIYQTPGKLLRKTIFFFLNSLWLLKWHGFGKILRSSRWWKNWKIVSRQDDIETKLIEWAYSMSNTWYYFWLQSISKSNAFL